MLALEQLLSAHLSSFFLSSLLLLLAGVLPTPARGHYHRSPDPPVRSCKAVPGTPTWPAPDTWAQLNVSTGGRLLQPAPPGAVCHPGQPTYDAAACVRLNANGSTAGGWADFAFHAADPVSVDWQQFSNDTCLPAPADPCSGQGYPVFVVNATTAEHVQRGVEFARKHNIRLIVKASGHDYLGRSVAPNSLSIWTRHIQGFQTHDSFSPEGCCGVTINHTAVSVGAGTNMYDMYTKMGTLNQTVVGGGGKTVGVGGYLTGGGHSLLSARYGLGADQVLEMKVVTPTGRIVTANECQHTDLFWAMRGGGGSTFGIMTEVTVKTYPSPTLVNMQLAIVTLNVGSPSIFPMVAYVLSQYPAFAEAGLSGYSYFFGNFASPTSGNAKVGGIAGTFVLQDTQDPNAALALWGPTLNYINQTWPGEFLILPNVTTFPSFLAWYSENFDTSTAGLDQWTGSRLLDEPALTGNLTRSAELLGEFAVAGGTGTAYLVSGPGVHNAQPRGGGNAVLPAWRTAYIHATTGVQFSPLNATVRAETLMQIGEIVEPLRRLAPNSGAYMNEADPAEPDWQHQFWGSNYDRLLAIKRSVDPDDVLWCNPCVGNERWHEVEGQLCPV